MILKSERLRKLEKELEDLRQWLNLGLVPKKDIDKHKLEIESIEKKIEEEKERLRYLKESGDGEEYVAPKKSIGGRQAFQEPHTLHDMGAATEEVTESGIESETESYEGETTFSEETEESPATEERTIYEEDEDPFSDRNRWRRGVLEDPDADNW
ncbi:MAG: hypothetical protein Tsb0015_17020 [Simkaniaceae bacterium]